MQTYLDNLLLEAGFDDPNQVEMMREELEPLLVDRLFTNLLARIPNEDHEEFMTAVETWTPENFDALCRKYVANYDEVMQNTLDEFANEYLENFDEDEDDDL